MNDPDHSKAAFAYILRSSNSRIIRLFFARRLCFRCSSCITNIKQAATYKQTSISNITIPLFDTFYITHNCAINKRIR